MRLRRLSFLLASVLLSAASALAGDVYDNGPVNGTVDAWTINFGFAISDSFTISGSNQTINGISFGVWLSPGDVIQSVEVSMTSDPLGGTTYFDGVVNLTQSGCFENQLSYQVCTASGTFNGPTLVPGFYWLNLLNATSRDGNPVYWDENSGIGCTSPGCPSLGDENGCLQNGAPGGCIPSESFTLSNNGSATVPEPSSALLFGSGFLTVIAVLRRRFC